MDTCNAIQFLHQKAQLVQYANLSYTYFVLVNLSQWLKGGLVHTEKVKMTGVAHTKDNEIVQ